MLLSNLGMDLAVAWKTGDEWGENPPVSVGKPHSTVTFTSEWVLGAFFLEGESYCQ